MSANFTYGYKILSIRYFLAYPKCWWNLFILNKRYPIPIYPDIDMNSCLNHNLFFSIIFHTRLCDEVIHLCIEKITYVIYILFWGMFGIYVNYSNYLLELPLNIPSQKTVHVFVKNRGGKRLNMCTQLRLGIGTMPRGMQDFIAGNKALLFGSSILQQFFFQNSYPDIFFPDNLAQLRPLYWY